MQPATPIPLTEALEMSLEELLSLSEYRDQFESRSVPNGSRTWYARELMQILGYEDFESFKKAINKATQACVALDIQIQENFQQVEHNGLADYKLSRFACYLVAMNADSRKPQVAMMQAYFIGLAETMRQYIEDVENLDRVVIRDELTERVKEQQHVAKMYGVENYALFHNAGFRGMYNMNLGDLKFHKGVDRGRTLYDFMGSTELAANLFRVTQTSERIKQGGAKGQLWLESIAASVGRKVRETMIQISGVAPENLTPAQDIHDVQKGLKGTNKEFKKLDKKNH